jgi:hypothetical protein
LTRAARAAAALYPYLSVSEELAEKVAAGAVRPVANNPSGRAIKFDRSHQLVGLTVSLAEGLI